MRLLFSLFLLLIHCISIGGQVDNCGLSNQPSKESFIDRFLHTISPSRILGGNESPVGKWPWQVLIKTNSSLNPGTVFLESDRKVVAIVIGSVYARENSTNMTVQSKNVTTHEAYEPDTEDISRNTTMINDIALIELGESLSFDDTVSPVCLPSKDTKIPEDSIVIATGFGLSNHRSERDDFFPSRTLLETVLPLIPIDICTKRWKSLTGTSILDTQLCGGSYGHGTAPGDSGGPLVMKSTSGRWFQIGLTSFGLNDDKYLIEQDLSPGVYTNIEKYCEWIKENSRGEVKCQSATLIDATSATTAHTMTLTFTAIVVINLAKNS